MTSQAYRRRTARLKNILSQQRIDDNQGIMVKLSPQNQLYLNVTKPCRVRIPASMLEEKVTNFKAGVPCVLKVTYREKQMTVYHRYEGKGVWVPSAPTRVGKPNDALTIDVDHLDGQAFLDGLPEIVLRNRKRLAWMADETRVSKAFEGHRIKLRLKQKPAIEGTEGVDLLAESVGKLDVKNSIGFIDLSFRDVFRVPVVIRLNHDGNRRTFLGVRMHRKNFRVRFMSFDGVRLRFLYEYYPGLSSTTVYLKEPSLLYRLGEMTELPLDYYNIAAVDKMSLVESVKPLRKLETEMVNHGSNYETGRLGAEIAYTIVGEKLGHKESVLQEPARRGVDISTRDRKLVVEARFIIKVEPEDLKTQIERDMMQMVRKLRRDFRYTSEAVVGCAVLSYLDGECIRSLIAEVDPQR